MRYGSGTKRSGKHIANYLTVMDEFRVVNQSTLPAEAGNCVAATAMGAAGVRGERSDVEFAKLRQV